MIGATPASALNCGGRNQPYCNETPPPGAVLNPPPGGNPYNLQPLSTPLTPSTPLWPKVRGHKPYGFNASSAGRDGTTDDDEAWLHTQMGASLARIGADWGGIQYYPNTGAGGRPWDYASYSDARYLAFIKAGVRPLLTITRTPRRWTYYWNTYSNSHLPGCGRADACWYPPRAPEMHRLRTFAADRAKRYPLAAGVELWNEPNIANPFWGTDPPAPEYYASMLDAAHDGVKSVRPNMPVIGGGLSSSDSDTYVGGYQVMSVRTFVRRMLAAGAQDNMDGISYHPYIGHEDADWLLAGRMAQVDTQVKNAYADAGKAMTERVAITELGASTSDGFTEARQSAWTSYQYFMIDNDRSQLALSPRTDGVFIHETVEHPNAPAGLAWQRGFGFTRVKNAAGHFVPKTAYCTFRTLFGGFQGCPSALDPPG